VSLRGHIAGLRGAIMVDLIKWDESCRVGVKELDDQHKQLFKICNDLIRTVVENRVAETGLETIQQLTDYAEHHFRREEELLYQAGYSDAREHHLEHNRLMNDLLLFKSEYIAGDLDVSRVSEFLIEWILHHVKGTDRAYVDHLHGKGIS